MASQGLDRQQAEAVWKPFFDCVSAAPQDFTFVSARDFATPSAPNIDAVPAQALGPFPLKQVPGAVIADDRQGAPADNIFWAGNLEEAGVVWFAYQSAWLPTSLLEADRRESLADALFVAARHYLSLHFNKGLAGATAEAVAAAKDTPMNPAVTDAFALAITGAWDSLPIRRSRT